MCVYIIKKDWARKNTNSTARRLQHERNAADADHTEYTTCRAYPIIKVYNVYGV